MKRMFLVGLIAAVFLSSIFAQEFSFSASAKSRATAGEFTSDSDNVSAKDSATDPTTATLYLNPEFIMPMEIGPMTQIRAGLDFSAQVYNAGVIANTGVLKSVVTTTDLNGTKTTVTTTTEYSDQAAVGFNLYFNPTFEWTIWDEKIDFIVDPTVGLFCYNNNTFGAVIF